MRKALMKPPKRSNETREQEAFHIWQLESLRTSGDLSWNFRFCRKLKFSANERNKVREEEKKRKLEKWIKFDAAFSSRSTIIMV